MLEDLAFQLLNISFYTDEWDEDTLNNALSDVMDQLLHLKNIKENRTIYDTTFDLLDLLKEAYDRGHFEGEF